jgi:hypothetical protein
MGTKGEMEMQYSSESNDQSIRCPYCEQLIAGNTMYIMQHGIVCRQQWEVRNKQIQDNSSKQNNNDKN